MQMRDLCVMQRGCRHETLLQCFGDALPSSKCRNLCDLCLARNHPLLPPIPTAGGKLDDAVLKGLKKRWAAITMPGAWEGAAAGKRKRGGKGGKGSGKAGKAKSKRGKKAAAG